MRKTRLTPPEKLAVMYLCVRSIDVVSFFLFDFGTISSDSVVFFLFSALYVLNRIMVHRLTCTHKHLHMKTYIHKFRLTCTESFHDVPNHQMYPKTLIYEYIYS